MQPKAIVVGAGGISGAWFPPLKNENVRIAAVVDLNINAAQERIDQYDIDAIAYTNLETALRDVQPDFVLDLTIPEAHAEVTCTSLAAGCHVIGEKPMAASMSEAFRMLQASERSGKLYMVSQSRRWNNLHYNLKETVKSGEIGQVANINCDFFLGAHFGGFRDEMPSPLILDMSIHHFDLVRFLTGLDPISVYAVEFNPKGSWYKGDAAATCIFEMTGGVIFTYRGNWCAEGCHTGWNGDWRIIGDKGTLIYSGDKEVRGQCIAKSGGFHSTFKDTEIVNTSIEQETMHGALLEMLEFQKSGKTPQTECHDNIKSLAMVFAAIESSRKGRKVMISETLNGTRS